MELNGSYGKLLEQGQQMLNVYGFQLNTDIEFADVPRAGSRRKGKKVMTHETTGTIQSYYTSTAFTKRIARVMDDNQAPFVTELIGTVEDPENPQFGRQKVRVKNVQFTNIPVLNFSHGELVEQELQFVCDGFEFIDM